MTESLADLLKRQREPQPQQSAGTPVAKEVVATTEPEPQPSRHGFADIVAKATKSEPVTSPEAPDDPEEMARIAKEQAAKAAAVAAVVAGKAAKQAAEKTTVIAGKLKRRWQAYQAEVKAKLKAEASQKPHATVPAAQEHRSPLIVDGHAYPTHPIQPAPQDAVSFVNVVEAAKRKQVATPKGQHRNLRNGLILLGGLVVVGGLAWGGVEIWHQFHTTHSAVVAVKPPAKIKSTIGKTPTTAATRPKVAVLASPSSAPAIPLPRSAPVVALKKPQVATVQAPVARPVSEPARHEPGMPAPAVRHTRHYVESPTRHATNTARHQHGTSAPRRSGEAEHPSLEELLQAGEPAQ